MQQKYNVLHGKTQSEAQTKLRGHVIQRTHHLYNHPPKLDNALIA
jgi:hypothetical protein